MGQTASSPSSTPAEIPAMCPMHREPPASAPECPIKHDAGGKSMSLPAQCPIDHGKGKELNPLNQMPELAQAPAPNQSVVLPLARTESSIPRDPSAKWEYPSPQQFYNALVRKGWETPEEHVETMVEIHNFLNEEAWQEVLKWEKRSNRYVLNLHMLSQTYILCLAMMRIRISPDSRDDQARCRLKRASGCLPAGYCPPGSSELSSHAIPYSRFTSHYQQRASL